MTRKNKILLLISLISFFTSCASGDLGIKNENERYFDDALTVRAVNQADKISKITKLFNYSSTEEKFKSDMLTEDLFSQSVNSIPAIQNELKKGITVVIKLKEKKETLCFVTAYSPSTEMFELIKGKEKISMSKEELLDKWMKTETWGYSFLNISEFDNQRDLNNLFEQAIEMETFAPISARRAFHKLLDLDSTSSNFALALGNSYFPREIDKAIKYTEIAIQNDPNRFESWFNLVAFQNAAGKKREARRTSRKILSMFQGDRISSAEFKMLTSI